MACVALFLLVLCATSKATLISPHSCNLSIQSSEIASGADMDMTMDPPQVATPLQYCVIDNCTIMRIDSREELDIIYTTENLLVAVPTDGHTSEMVSKHENKVPCSPILNDSGRSLIRSQITYSTILGSTCACIMVLHLLFSELHTVIGNLLMSYNVVLLLV